MQGLDPDKITTIVLLVAIVVAFSRGWIVPKVTHQREIRRGDKAFDLAQTAVQTLRELASKVNED